MRSIQQTICALATSCLTAAAFAQADPSYPSTPRRLFIPFAAGGTNGTGGRLVCRELSKALGQRVVVENRAGSGGLIGTEAALKAPADGYTMLRGSISTLAILPAVSRK